jgi:sporulation protein YlmC with PRC-barrel domain
MSTTTAKAAKDDPQALPAAMVSWAVRGIVGSSDIIGIDVVDSREEYVGKLADVLLDMHTGRIAYGVVLLDRAPRWSGRSIAVPWNAMRLDHGAERLCVLAVRDWIQRAPSMQPDDMPNMLDRDCAIMIHSYFGTKPYWEPAAQQHS